MAFAIFGGVEDEERIARIIRDAYEEQLKTINGDSCFEQIAAERIIASIPPRDGAKP